VSGLEIFGPGWKIMSQAINSDLTVGVVHAPERFRGLVNLLAFGGVHLVAIATLFGPINLKLVGIAVLSFLVRKFGIRVCECQYRVWRFCSDYQYRRTCDHYVTGRGKSIERPL
jgi:hypothetical protein